MGERLARRAPHRNNETFWLILTETFSVSLQVELPPAIRQRNEFNLRRAHLFVSEVLQSMSKASSTSLNASKNEPKRSMALWTSWDPAISRIECMDSIAHPTSTVLIPDLESVGPTVEPQGLQRNNLQYQSSGRVTGIITCHSALRTPALCRPFV